MRFLFFGMAFVYYNITINNYNMITVNDLQKEYLLPINKGFKKDIEKFISDTKVQTWIKKAMKGKLTDNEVSEIYKLGKKGGQMPNLYWLLCIYIHPLTTTSFIYKKINL